MKTRLSARQDAGHEMLEYEMLDGGCWDAGDDGTMGRWNAGKAGHETLDAA